MFRNLFASLFRKKILDAPKNAKIAVDLSYDKTHIDEQMTKRINGLILLNDVSHHPTEKPYFAFRIDISTTIENISLFLDTFPDDFQFSFFDKFYPQISDPGAYVTIQSNDGNFIYQLGNHGWSSEWKAIIKDELVDYIYKNREFQTNDSIEVYRRFKKCTEGEWP